MVDAISFKTRARTIDHLGREQIADCPTAISELWKNSYDAYATEVALHIYDDEIPIAALLDDGHGMSRDEFVSKWLVVGTESKATGTEVPVEDRNGLAFRPRQGQKGIGRLSSAALGPLLLIVSKRINHLFVAGLLDWRIFENPFLYLQDIEIPVVEFAYQDELFMQLPLMFKKLMRNIWGGSEDKDRDQRVMSAWNEYDLFEKQNGQFSTREAIEHVIITTAFSPLHLDEWDVWKGRKASGTALIIGDVVFDLEAQITNRIPSEDSSAAEQARKRLFQTLSNFTDPFVDSYELQEGYAAKDFRFSVTAWSGALRKAVISDDRVFDLGNLEGLEHVVDGQVDEGGVFKGRIKAFGHWLEGGVTIPPKIGIPSRSDSKVGPFHLRLGTYERTLTSSSHTPEVFGKLNEQAELYAGFMVYRNGLRVMPYGREDNDFFEIEKRRSQHAGREFWGNRRTFGRVAITRELNPNLKDKAGREGIIDNKAAKVFRDLVENILMTTARRYFGTDAEVRQQLLPEVQKSKARERADDAARKIKALRRREFRAILTQNSQALPALLAKLQDYKMLPESELVNDESELLKRRTELAEIGGRLKELAIGAPPSNLGTLEQGYIAYRRDFAHAKELLGQLNDAAAKLIEILKPKAPRKIAFSELSRNAAFLHTRLRKWLQEAKEILTSEVNRVSTLIEERNKKYHLVMLPIIEDIEHNRISLTQALDDLDKEREKQDRENAELFEPYIDTLKILRDSIDIESLVTISMEESAELRQELDRLNSLAQLGITVEIIGHEIEGLEMAVSRGLREMPNDVKQTAAFNSIKTAHEMLADRLRFLSPLKLSGERIKIPIKGEKIVEYISAFFGEKFERNEIAFEATPDFLRFSVYEQVSRIYPVFLNLINNAAYWVGLSKEGQKRILIDVIDHKVVVSDNGPGVEDDDIKHLFSLFFTRKVRGGRGVGLYLCRANLAAGGHTIEYATERSNKKLPGANFIINFKGASYA